MNGLGNAASRAGKRTSGGAPTLGQVVVAFDAAIWLPILIPAVTAFAALWRVQVERQRNKVLRDQLEAARREPDVEILGIRSTGGGGNSVTFAVEIQNTGTKLTRAQVSAFVGTAEVQVDPATLDLLVNMPPTGVEVAVPRPQLGQLMAECGHETTLYNETLRVRIDAGGETVEETWHEHVYEETENRPRHEVQRRYWRVGRGDETADDLRAEALREHIDRVESGEGERGRYQDV